MMRALSLPLVVMLLSTNAGLAADQQAPDPWAPVRFLIGRWEGEASGQPGNGTVVRTYAFVLKDRFIHERNTSTYPAQEKNPKGEVHEHLSFLSYDRVRKVLVLRQFHQESFVNQFAFNAAASTEKKLVFDSESIENLPVGFKARETYEVLGPDEFTETFEIAEPGKVLEVYGRSHFRRRK